MKNVLVNQFAEWNLVKCETLQLFWVEGDARKLQWKVLYYEKARSGNCQGQKIHQASEIQRWMSIRYCCNWKLAVIFYSKITKTMVQELKDNGFEFLAEMKVAFEVAHLIKWSYDMHIVLCNIWFWLLVFDEISVLHYSTLVLMHEIPYKFSVPETTDNLRSNQMLRHMVF